MIAELAERLDLKHVRFSLYKGRCPECCKEEFWLRATGPNEKAWCNACGYETSPSQLGRQHGLDVGWGEPDPPGPSRPDAFPVEALPDVLADHVNSVALSVQVPGGMPALFSLVAVSSAVAGKFEVLPDESWTSEWCCIYGVVIASPGERKSATVLAMTGPIRKWEEERQRECGPARLARLDSLDIATQRFERTKKQAVMDKATIEEVEAARLEMETAKAALIPLPRVLVGDATPEALVACMAEQGGRASVITAEGDVFRIADGRYSDGAARLDEYKKAWSGETLAPERVGRETVRVDSPALTLGAAIQPGVLESLRNRGSMRGEGFFARCLWLRPTSLVGRRKNSGDATALDRGAAQRYSRMLYRLLDFNSEQAVGLKIEDRALKSLYAYMDQVEEAKRPGRDLHEIIDIAEKLHGNAVRVAVMLELAEQADRGLDLSTATISERSMLNAIQIMEALTTHAQTVYTELGESDLQYVWRRLLELCTNSDDDVSVRDLVRRCQKSGVNAKKVAEAIDELEHRGCVQKGTRRNPKGGRPAQCIQLHPDFRKATDRTDKTPSVSFVSPVAEIQEAIGILREVAL